MFEDNQISPVALAKGDKPGDQGPEDIFSQTVPVEQNEPSLKAAPSPFVKKNEGQEIMSSQMPAMPGVLPAMPKIGLNKKNLIIFIFIIVVVIGLASAAVWLFTSKKNNNDSNINPAVLDLFDNANTNPAPSKPAEQAAETPPVSQPQQIADVDGDGLSDQEEASLGTSINSPDTDNDGLSDREEVKVYKTDPLKSDTDDDGWKDGEEVRKNQDPLSSDPALLPENYFQSKEYHFGFIYPKEMVLESSQASIVQFNDNINQIKLYIYINGSQLSLPAADVSYIVGQEGNKLIIKDSLKNPEDATPYATEFAIQYYTADNGLSYLIRYVATKRADNHQEKFENILKTFEFN
ncbi:hypothetical protein A3B87_02890 [Candidatus Kuenenbacteria bacterium RIFCSPHIGHO2_02_FULL_39_13]|uniref:Uncharacterized protein n=1 Tax=Candidatus Kuenenbacteria bacterium RIFCSPHIGHO2_02_FULL_39_13 TaxID=1798561 RepID=A0A1F6FN10_9BACT|nr:MAG: hypothetical protein A3B87_02890 [Candidatus Kuenenbacteria bacterium RIFCSPHIGHO2_02_FULL_39_13]